MKAIVCRKYGKVGVLKIEEFETPVPKSDEVLIEVMAASVNPVDWKIRNGSLLIKTGMKPPKILGSDFSGVVLAIGSQVNEYSKGDEVWGKFDSFKGGSYAQKVLAKSHNISLKPKNLSFVEAASIPNVALTAYQAMVSKSVLTKGQKVLINGASGGVGLMAVQIAKIKGCHVTAVCSDKNMNLVKSMGADKVLNYLEEEILAATNYYHVFFDCVSNKPFYKVWSTLKAGGTHIKTTPGLITTVGAVLKFIKIKYPDHIMVKPIHRDLIQLKQWVENGSLKPCIQEVYVMNDVGKAHQMSETGHVIGKLVIDMQ